MKPLGNQVVQIEPESASSGGRIVDETLTGSEFWKAVPLRDPLLELGPALALLRPSATSRLGYRGVVVEETGRNPARIVLSVERCSKSPLKFTPTHTDWRSFIKPYRMLVVRLHVDTPHYAITREPSRY